MKKGMLTQREEELMQALLAHRGITAYQLFDVTQEGGKTITMMASITWAIDELRTIIR